MEARLSAQVEQILLKRIAENTLALPAANPVVSKCLTLTRDPNFSMREAAKLVEQEPVLAARVLRSANSAANAGIDKAKSIPQALTRIGMERLKTVLVEVSAQRLFESRDARIAEACRGLWDHSLAVAIVARDVAALSGAEDSEAAYLAGLLHDVGKPAVAWGLLEAERVVVGTRTNFWIEPGSWVQVIQSCHRSVGVALSQRWMLGESVSRAIADCAEYDAGERVSTANCVRFANALTKREGLYVGEVDHEDNNALIMIGRSLLNVDDSVLSRLCTGLADRVRQASL